MNQDTMLLILAGTLLVLLLVIIILLAAQNSRIRRERAQQEKGVDRLNQAMGHSLRQMAELSGALDARMEALTRQNDEKLTEMRRVVGESLDGRLSQSFRVVNSQLADVHRGIGEMKELAANVTDLKKVLGNVKTRGVWGEMLLKNVLSQMFSPEQFIENAAIPAGSQQRVEFALKLPCTDGEALLLPIDSKFPQEDYIRLMDAEDEIQREKCAKLLERAVLEQAKTIAEKYIRPPQTSDFAVLFLPAEGLYAEAARIPGLIEKAQTKFRVLIAGPGTLCALLTSLQVSFRTSALEKRSGEVLELFDELRTEFARFQESITRARGRLNQAEAELDAMEARARKIGKKLM
ncbi:MAG: DNA recombination protein RmuC [Clostridia bacterium]|nr:DNA recombination protein RmuC [Clostridia bacterium]